jgi:hypothetical protein
MATKTAKKPAAKKSAKPRIRTTNGNGTGDHVVPEIVLHSYKPIAAIQSKIANEATRGVGRVTKIKAYGFPDPQIAGVAQKIQELQSHLVDLITAIPDEWRPARGAMSTPIEVGAKVSLADRVVDKWTGIIAATDELEVVRIVGNKVVCKVNGSALQVPLLRTQVRRQAEVSAAN